eukprot:UN20453
MLQKEYHIFRTLPAQDVIVITGRGNHSKNGSILKPALLEYFSTVDGLQCFEDSYNDGKLILTYQSVRTLLREGRFCEKTRISERPRGFGKILETFSLII